MNQLLEVAEVSELLKCSQNKVYDLIKRGQLKGLKLGSMKVSTIELDNFMSRNAGIDLTDPPISRAGEEADQKYAAPKKLITIDLKELKKEKVSSRSITKPKSTPKPKRKKKCKEVPYPSDEFRGLKGAKRERLITERKEKGYTQAQLGKLVGCSGGMIAQLETGRSDPGLEVSMNLEMIFKVPLFELFPDL